MLQLLDRSKIKTGRLLRSFLKGVRSKRGRPRGYGSHDWKKVERVFQDVLSISYQFVHINCLDEHEFILK